VELVLALDAGTSGVRTVAFDRSATVQDTAHRELTQHFPRPGEVEHDANEIAALCVATLRDVATRARANGHDIVALASPISARQRSPSTVRRDDSPTAPSSGRTGAPAPTATNSTRVVRRRSCAPRRDSCSILTSRRPRCAGSSITVTWTTSTHRAFATVDSWLVWWLSGGAEDGAFVTEPSNASRTMLMDLATMSWSNTMTTLFDVDPAMLATIQPSLSNFATVSADVVPELAGVPITGVLGDQQSALFGQACFRPGVVKATYGTGAFILANVGENHPGVFDG